MRAKGMWVRGFLGQSTWIASERLFRLICGVLVGAWVARHLGPTGYGDLATCLAAVALLAPLADLGLRELYLRDGNHTLAAALTLRLLGATIAGFIALVGLPFVVSTEQTELILPVVLAMILSVHDLFEWPWMAHGRMQIPTICRCGVLLFGAAWKIGLILSECGTAAFAWALILEAAVQAIAFMYLSRDMVTKIRAPTRAALWSLFKKTWPLALSALLVTLYMRIDVVLLNFWYGAHASGEYAVAVRIAETGFIIPTSIAIAAQPAILRGMQVDPDGYKLRLTRLFRLFHLVGFAQGVVLCFAAEWIVRILFGPAFGHAADVLRILAWAPWFVGLGIARSIHLIGIHDQTAHLITVLIGACSGIIVAWAAIPHLGAVGAACATLVAYGMAALGSCWCIPRLRPTGAWMLQSLWSNQHP